MRHKAAKYRIEECLRTLRRTNSINVNKLPTEPNMIKTRLSMGKPCSIKYRIRAGRTIGVVELLAIVAIVVVFIIAFIASTVSDILMIYYS